MNYLVTGGAGFIGSAVVRKLLDETEAVTVIDNLSTGYLSNVPDAVTFINGDVSDQRVFDELNNQNFDAIIHLAGQSSGEISFDDPVKDLNSNVVSTLLLLEYAVHTNCKRFIYASSMSVYGDQPNIQKYSEKDFINPKSFYAVGKLASEKYMKVYSDQYGIIYTGLRYFNVYGPGQNLSNLRQGMVSIYLKQFIDDAYKSVEVKGSIERFRDLIYIDDVVNITIDSLNNKHFLNEVINVATGTKTTVGMILKMLKNLLKSDKEIVISSGTIADQFGIYADVSKLKKIYPNDLISFKNGLKKMLDSGEYEV
jgi:UDP-glucose 4-epimerase